MGGEGVVEVGGGVGGRDGRVEEQDEEMDGDDGGQPGVGGRVPCGAGGLLPGGV